MGELDLGEESTNDQKAQFLTLLKSYNGVLHTEGSQLSFCPWLEHRTNAGTQGLSKSFSKASVFGNKLRTVQMKNLVDLWVISPSEIEWNAKVILVRTKGKRYRRVTDSRPLNRVTIKDTYHIGNIQTILQSIHGISCCQLSISFQGNTIFQQPSAIDLRKRL